jgi:hypothetical protein
MPQHRFSRTTLGRTIPLDLDGPPDDWIAAGEPGAWTR